MHTSENPIPFMISGHVSICRPINVPNALQILPLDQTFNLLLQEVDVGREAGSQLLDHFGDELLVLELLALPARKKTFN